MFAGSAIAQGSFPPFVGGGIPRLLTSAWEDRDTIRARLRLLATVTPALDLRLARVLAWLRAQDLAPLGYPGWLAFTREHVDWGEAWIRSLVRLVRSGLGEVLRAACEGRVPLPVAVTAPSTCAPADQAAWVAAAEVGAQPTRRRPPSGASFTIEPDQADSLRIWHARQKARLLEGLPLTDREADERMLAWWRADRPEELIARALAPAPAPPAAPGDGAPEWPFADPADPLVGPWRTPSDLADAMDLLAAVQAARRGRVIELGRLYEQVVRAGLYRCWGFRDVESFCKATMQRSARSLQRDRDLGCALRRLPVLQDSKLSLARVAAVGRVANEDDVERWLAVAARTPVIELERAVQHVAAGADGDALLDAYEGVMASTTGSVGLAAIQAPVPPRPTDRVHPDLPKAARWLLAVQLPPQRGFGRVKERDRFVCANPECRRRALRNHAHHLRFRQDGGDDTLENGACVCPSCHLRLIHAGHVTVEMLGTTLVWTFPGRVVTVVGP
jgi:hypothetical protein